MNDSLLNDFCFEEGTTLMASVEDKNLEMVDHLINLGCDVNIRDYYGDTVLHILVNEFRDRYGYGYEKKIYPIYEKILDSGFDVKLKNKEGSTILHQVCSLVSMDVVPFEKIVSICDPDEPDNNGMNALMTAFYNNDSVSSEMAKILIKASKNINHTDKKGCSLLRYALRQSNEEIFNILVEYGAKDETLGKDPWNPSRWGDRWDDPLKDPLKDHQ